MGRLVRFRESDAILNKYVESLLICTENPHILHVTAFFRSAKQGTDGYIAGKGQAVELARKNPPPRRAPGNTTSTVLMNCARPTPDSFFGDIPDVGSGKAAARADE